MVAPVREQAVALGEGAAALHGTLALPAGAGRFDAVLIWSGSGPTDRDGNSPLGLSNNCLKMVAHALAEAGYASLRTDKRGIGESEPAGPEEEDARFGMFVDDAVAWAEFLRTVPGVRRVFLLGHSEGALVATMAAQRFPAAGLVLLAGAGFRAPDILRRQIAAPEVEVPEHLQTETFAILDALERGETFAEVSPELHAAYRPSVQPYLVSWFALDPAVEQAKLSLPAIVIQGEHDLQVSMADAERLAATRSGIRLVRIPGMNHVLKDAPAEVQANYATYFRPMLPLSAGLMPALSDFLRAATAANDR